MAIDPSLITDTMARWQAPPPVQVADPLAQYAKIQALKSGIIQQQVQQQALQSGLIEQQLNRARIAEVQAQADQRQADQSDQQALMQGLQNPDIAQKAVDWKPGQPIPIPGIKQQKNWQAFWDKSQTDKANALKLNDDQLAAADKLHGKFADTLYGLGYNPDGSARSDEDIAKDFPGVWQGAISQGYVPKGTPMPTVSGMADLQNYERLNNYAKAIGQSVQAARKEAQDIQTGASNAAKNLSEAAQFAANAADLRAKLPKEQADAQIAQLEAEFRKAHNGLSAAELATNQVQRGELAVKQAAENRQSKEFNAKFGSPESRQMFVQSVLNDPDSYFSLSPDMKVGVANDLIAMGKNVPVQIPSDLKGRAVSADLGLAAIQRVQALLADPDIAKAIGPISGNLGNLEQGIGNTFFGEGTAQAKKEQELRTSLATLKYLETKGLLGGRPASKMIDGLTSVMARPSQAMPLMQGSLSAIQANLNDIKNEARSYAMGGASGPGVQGTASPPQPARPKNPFR